MTMLTEKIDTLNHKLEKIISLLSNATQDSAQAKPVKTKEKTNEKTKAKKEKPDKISQVLTLVDENGASKPEKEEKKEKPKTKKKKATKEPTQDTE